MRPRIADGEVKPLRLCLCPLQEERQRHLERLRELEKADVKEEFKQSIKSTKVTAFFCEQVRPSEASLSSQKRSLAEALRRRLFFLSKTLPSLCPLSCFSQCRRFCDKVNPVCASQGHRQTMKEATKTLLECEACGCKPIVSINNQLPAWCPKCEATLKRTARTQERQKLSPALKEGTLRCTPCP